MVVGQSGTSGPRVPTPVGDPQSIEQDSVIILSPALTGVHVKDRVYKQNWSVPVLVQVST